MATLPLIMFFDISHEETTMIKQTLLIMIISLSCFSTYASNPGTTVYADVNGLVCDFCARAIEKIFKKESAVHSIDVNLDEKVITIQFIEDQKMDDARIEELINDSGYTLRELRYAE